MRLTALDLYILTETLLESLHISDWSGTAKKEAREILLDKLQMIMSSMNVEVLADTSELTTMSADIGI